MGLRFLVNWHHHLIADELEKVFKSESKNLLIEVAPGSSKTELVVINGMARGLALNPRSRFLHLSGSDNLASLNSATARSIVTSDDFQAFWPMRIADDARAKKRWNVEIDGYPAGGVYATALGGQVTGFRGGHMVDGEDQNKFWGAVVIDDPVKPEDAYSRSELKNANRLLVTTVKSRRATTRTPIIMIMQRIAKMDPAGFVEAGGLDSLEGDWKIVKIPAVLDQAYFETLAPKYQDMIASDPQPEMENRRSYWQFKEPVEQLLQMELGKGTDPNGAKISRHVFSSQYQQEPVVLGGNIIKGEWFPRYTSHPRILYRNIYSDTAQKTKEQNDWSVFGELGFGDDGHAYVLNWLRGKWESPDLRRQAILFWGAAKKRNVEEFGSLRKLKVEDKSSGTDLVQSLRLPPFNIPIEGIERTKDKLTRVMDALPYFDQGQMHLPADALYTPGIIAEAEAFSADDTHDFDDQVDVLLDGACDLLQADGAMKTWVELGRQARQG